MPEDRFLVGSGSAAASAEWTLGIAAERSIARNRIAKIVLE